MINIVKKINCLLLVIILMLFSTQYIYAQKSYKDLKYPPLGELKIPEVKREVLPNGMILFLAEDHQLPVIGVSVLVKTGSIYELADKIGLA